MAQLWRVKTEITGPSGLPGLSQMYFAKEPGLDPYNAVSRTRNFWWGVRSYMSSAVGTQTSNEVEVIDVDSGNIIDLVTTSTVDAANGTDAGDLMPLSTQGLGRFTTGVYVAGRQLRGRVFIPGATESNNTAGAPGSGYLSSVAGELNGLAAVSITVIPVVYSTTHHVAAPMSGASLWNKWAILRSRRD